MPQTPDISPTPTEDVQLSAEAIEAETARGRITALFALAAVLTISGSLVAALSVSKSVVTAKNSAQFLSAIHDHKAAVIVAACLFAVGTACTIPVLLHLAVAARMRRPRVPGIVVQLSTAGPLILALIIPLTAVLYARVTNDFVSGADQTVKAADDLLKGDGLTAARIVALVGSISAGFAWIMVGAYGIRTGLLTRLVGSVAVGVGLLTALATNVVPPVVELLKVFELGAIAVMLVGPPEKQPAAWREGRAIAWQPLGSKRPPEDRQLHD
ncbi:MAG: hypothetical protein JJE27_02870 [Thermoleophilia bacterium]|nr:hypothetical protein [Thermoleophilia bacterium]